MSIVTETYTRKPFSIEAVRVTEENMEDVAKWCGGEIHKYNGKRFIKVDVARPLTEKQTKAFAGDWVLRVKTSFKVYQHKAFVSNFDKVVSVEDTDTQDTLPFEKPAPKIHMPANYPEPSTR